MNWKRFFMASLMVYLVVQAIDFVVNQVFMMSAYESLKNLWRTNMSSRMWLMYAVGVLVALFFTFIFVKGREGKGVTEGIRYGVIIWLFVNVPSNIGMWVLLPIPYTVILKWMIYGLLEMLVAGILVAVIYKPLTVSKT